jgi:hypothetical protein
MFLHLFIEDVQLTENVLRVVQRNLKSKDQQSIEVLKLEIIHENQFSEYGVLSKEQKYETLYSFQRTVHIPIEGSALQPTASPGEEDSHSNYQKFSLALFALISKDQQQQQIQLGNGIITSSRNADKSMDKTVILRNDKFDVIGRLTVTLFYHDSLLDLSENVIFKKPTKDKLDNEKEYAFLLSRKFRRSEVDFPSSFDPRLENRLIHDSEYYIENLKDKQVVGKGRNGRSSKDFSARKQFPGNIRSSSTGKMRSPASFGMSSNQVNSNQRQGITRLAATPVSNDLTKRSRSTSAQKKRKESQSSAVFNPPRPSHPFLTQQHAYNHHIQNNSPEPPKLRKTVMSVGFVHNNWPDPHDNEKEKREYQLRMAEERKSQLLTQIAQEVQHQHERSEFLKKRNLLQKIEESKEKEIKRKKRLTKELKHREHEIKDLQEKLNEIRLQSLLSHHHSPPVKVFPSSSGSSHVKAAPPNSSTKPAAIVANAKQRAASPANLKAVQRATTVKELLEKEYHNFFKQKPPVPPSTAEKKKAVTSSKRKTKKPSSVSSTVNDTQEQPSYHPSNPMTKIDDNKIKSTAQLKAGLKSEKQGNQVIQVSVKRASHPYRHRRSVLEDRYPTAKSLNENLADFISEQFIPSSENNKVNDNFHFHQVYQKPNNAYFDSDSDFLKLNENFKRSSSMSRGGDDDNFDVSRHASKNPASETDDEEEELSDKMANEIALLHQAFSPVVVTGHDRDKKHEVMNIDKSALPETSVNESYQSDEYAVPGFLQAMIQSTDRMEDDFNASLEYGSPGEMDDEEFERKFQFSVEEEEEDDEEESDNISPSEPLGSDEPRGSETIKSATLLPVMGLRSQDDVLGNKGNRVNRGVVQNDDVFVASPLDTVEKYEFSLNGGNSTLSTSQGNHPGKESPKRSRSRDRVIQQFEKNRQYALHSNGTTSLSNTASSNSATNTTASAASSSLDTGHVNADLMFNNIDAILARTDNALDQTMQSTKLAEAGNRQEKANKGRAAIRSDDLSSDEDTVEKNIMDSHSYNAKLVSRSEDSSQSESQKDKESICIDNTQKPTSDKDLTNLGESLQDFELGDNVDPQTLSKRLEQISSRMSHLLSETTNISPIVFQKENKAVKSDSGAAAFSAPDVGQNIHLDYSKPVRKVSSSVQRQFEKNRQYASSNSSSKGSFSVSEREINSANGKGESSSDQEGVSLRSGSQPEMLNGSSSSGSLTSVYASPSYLSSTSGPGRVRSIVSQFEKNRRYNSSDTALSNSGQVLTTGENVAKHRSDFVNGQPSSLDDKNGASFQPYSMKNDLQTEWNAIEHDLNKLEVCKLFTVGVFIYLCFFSSAFKALIILFQTRRPKARILLLLLANMAPYMTEQSM